MQAVRGSRVRMAAPWACSHSTAAPLASSGTSGSTAHTRSSGCNSTVTSRRILYSARWLCSAPSTPLSHSRRKAGAWSEGAGTLKEKAGLYGCTERQGQAQQEWRGRARGQGWGRLRGAWKRGRHTGAWGCVGVGHMGAYKGVGVHGEEG